MSTELENRTRKESWTKSRVENGILGNQLADGSTSRREMMMGRLLQVTTKQITLLHIRQRIRQAPLAYHLEETHVAVGRRTEEEVEVEATRLSLLRSQP